MHLHNPEASPLRRRPLLALLLGLAVLQGGCDIPTGLPSFETEWSAPGPSTILEAAGFLPDEVTVSEDGSGVTIELARADSVTRLGSLCPVCSEFDGFRVLKPAFEATLDLALPLPAAAVAGSLTSGQVEVELSHSFGFDPIRPGLGNTGEVRVQLLAGETVVGSASLEGTSEPFPQGRILRRTMDLSPGAIGGAPLMARVAISSPLGASTLINENTTFTVAVVPGPLVLSEITVGASGGAAPLTPRLIEVGGIGPSVATRISSGTLELAFANPFGRSLDLILQIEGGGFDTIERAVTVSPDPTSSSTVEFTGEELVTFLGLSSVRLRGSATPTDAGDLRIDPADFLALSSRWRFRVRAGG